MIVLTIVGTILVTVTMIITVAPGYNAKLPTPIPSIILTHDRLKHITDQIAVLAVGIKLPRAHLIKMTGRIRGYKGPAVHCMAAGALRADDGSRVIPVSKAQFNRNLIWLLIAKIMTVATVHERR
jgi:hypothetical protein